MSNEGRFAGVSPEQARMVQHIENQQQKMYDAIQRQGDALERIAVALERFVPIANQVSELLADADEVILVKGEPDDPTVPN